MNPPQRPHQPLVPVNIGDILNLRDDEYRYGRGPLALRVLDIHSVRRLPDGPWVFLRGMRLDARGRDVEQRDVLVSLRRCSATGNNHQVSDSRADHQASTGGDILWY